MTQWLPVGSTQLAAVIGDPVRHSLSPVLHNAAFRAAGLDWVYVALPVARGEGGRAVEAMRVLGIGGLSVTMPHKADVAAACDELGDDAARLGSVNTVWRHGGRLRGDTTDGEGFVRSLRAAAVEPSGATVFVAGAGAAARSVVLALVRCGAAEVLVANRTAAHAHALAELVGGAVRVAPDASAADAAIVVNATSVGMSGDGRSEALPVAAQHLGEGQVVCDLVYHPRDTALLVAARARGARTIDGTAMLTHQAAMQFEMWTGEAAPLAAMQDALGRVLACREAAGRDG